jgi:hypothetical protein
MPQELQYLINTPLLGVGCAIGLVVGYLYTLELSDKARSGFALLLVRSYRTSTRNLYDEKKS